MNNYFYNPTNTESLNQYDIRIDENVRPQDTFFVVLDKSYFNEVTPGKMPGLAIGQSGAQNQQFPAYMISTGYVHGFTQHLFNELHAGYSHSNKIQETFDGNQFGIPEQYGIQGIPQVANNGGLTPVSISQFTGLGESGNRPTIQDVFDLTLTDTLTYTHDKHNIHAGVQEDDIHGNIIQPQYSRGMFNFGGEFSDIPNLNSGLTGVADALLKPQAATVNGGVNNVGGLTSYTGSAFNGSNYQRWFTGAFVQDDWKALPNLTLNLGLRWDYFTPYGDARGRQANFIPNGGGNGPTGTYYMSAEGCRVNRSASFDALLVSNGITLNCNANSRTGNAQKTNFAPRLGFAWRANEHLVVRGGYGITYGALANLGYNGTLGTNYPFVYTVSNSATTSQNPLVLPGGQTATVENTFSVLNLADPTLINGAGVQLYGRQYDYKTPYVESYNLSVQQELTAHDSIQIGYVGSVGRHLDILGVTNNPSTILPNGTNVANYVNFPGFARGSIYETTAAASSYNGLQTTFEHHTKFNLSVLANYTYSRCMTDQRSPQNSAAAGYRAQWLSGFGISGDYGVCDSDSPHVVHFAEIYKLPVGRGMLIGSNMNRALDAVIGGWQVNGIFTYQTGQPFTVSCATATSADFGCFANKVPGQSVYPAQRGRLNWLDAAAFATPALAATIGQTDYSVLGGGPDQARGPSYTNMDASLFKSFTFTQRWSAQFRIEAFNVFNHTQFGQPGSLNYTVPATFAQITALRGGPRIAQVAGRYSSNEQRRHQSNRHRKLGLFGWCLTRIRNLSSGAFARGKTMISKVGVNQWNRVFLPLILTVATISPATAQKAVPGRQGKSDITLEGDVRGGQNHTYVEVPFKVPPGTRRVTLTFSFTGKDQHAALDLGIEDVAQLRCWSGGNKSTLTVGEVDATPSCLPGSIPVGEWKLLIGVPNIRSTVVSHYTADVYFTRTGLVADEPAVLNAPLRDTPGWYRGDLHMHTAHSDGRCPNQSGQMVPCPVFVTVQSAAKRGLDFIAITDHNTTAHYDAMRELQPYFDKLLLIPGREITTFDGHANMFGTTDFLDFREDGKHVADMSTLLRKAQQLGGLVAINHPGAPTGEACMGCGWSPSPAADMHLVNAIEAVNGGSIENPKPGIEFWKRQLDLGYKITAIGGSDNHRADIPLDRRGSIGRPTTVVYAESLSTQAILMGIRSGRVFVDLTGSADRFLDFKATAENSSAVMGSSLQVSAGTEVTVEVHVSHCKGSTGNLQIDSAAAQPSFTQPIASDDQTLIFHWTSDGKRHWLHPEIADPDGHLLILGNAIYMN